MRILKIILHIYNYILLLSILINDNKFFPNLKENISWVKKNRSRSMVKKFGHYLDTKKKTGKDKTMTRLPITRGTRFGQERFGHHKATRLARERKK